MTRSDEALMCAIAGGDEKAFGLLYRRYKDRMYYYFLKMLNNDKQLAEDHVQQLFLKIAEKPGSFDVHRNFAVWLYSIACNQCKNEYRRKKQLSLGQVNGRSLNSNADREVEHGVDMGRFNEVLSRWLSQLDEDHKTVFIMRFREEFSIKEISEATGIPEGTVKSRLFYTTKKLSSEMDGYHPGYL